MSGTTDNNAGALITPPGLLAFPFLFEARPLPGNQQGKPRFSATLIFSPEAQQTPEYMALRRAVAEAIAGKWGAAALQNTAFLQTLRSPFRKSEEKAKYDGFTPGSVFISPWTQTMPGVVDANLGKMGKDDVWAGQEARFSVQAFAYANAGNQGVSFTLSNVQILKRNRPRLDGRAPAEATFGKAVDDSLPAVMPGMDPNAAGGQQSPEHAFAGIPPGAMAQGAAPASGAFDNLPF